MNRGLRIVAAAALAVFIMSGQAQGQDKRAGVNLGIDFSTLGGDIEELAGTNAETTTGFSAGGFIGIDVSNVLRIQLNGQYVQKGAKFEESGVRLTFDVPYVELLLPVTLLIPIESSSITPRVYAGPSLAFETSCDITLEVPPEPAVTVACSDFDAPTKTTDYGVFFGAGVDFAVGAGELVLDVLYNLGLANINNFPGDTETIKNRNFQILLGYAFLFGN